MTTLHDFGGGIGTAFEHFLLGSHNFMVTALGSCVKWPLVVLFLKAGVRRRPIPAWLYQITKVFIKNQVEHMCP